MSVVASGLVKLEVTDRHGQPHTLEVETGDTLMEVLRDEGFGVEAVCGGCCACATCHVYVPQALSAERGEIEGELLASTAHFNADASRLSCQIILREADDGLAVTVAPEE
jgi:ferredoxin, 2Fe-2S